MQSIRIQNRWNMKHFLVCYIGCYDISSHQIRQVQACNRKKTYCYFNVTLHSRKRNFCHTKLQTIIIKVGFSKFLYLIANWTPYQKPIKEALTILKSPSKLLITNSFNGQQLVAVEIISRNLNYFLKVPYAS